MKLKLLTRGQVRSLLKLQKGRCALTGRKIHPTSVSIDHILPISRADEFKNKKGFGKYWLVDPAINRMKGTLTVEELRAVVAEFDKFKDQSEKLKKEILENDLDAMSKDEFDEYIKKNYDEKGMIK